MKFREDAGHRNKLRPQRDGGQAAIPASQESGSSSSIALQTFRQPGKRHSLGNPAHWAGLTG